MRGDFDNADDREWLIAWIRSCPAARLTWVVDPALAGREFQADGGGLRVGLDLLRDLSSELYRLATKVRLMQWLTGALCQ